MIDLATLRAIHDANDDLAPFNTDYRIAYETGGKVKIAHPDPKFMAKLMAGGVIPRLRVIGSNEDTTPVLDGDGKILGPMTEREAIEFIRWRDVPREVNRWEIVREADLPTDRTFRNAWRLAA
jgi:hypothetical protein